MSLLSDGLLIAATLAAVFYCFVLSRRINALKSLDSGLGAAIAGLSQQAEEMRIALQETRRSAEQTFADLESQTEAAKLQADRLERLARKATNPARPRPTPAQPEPAEAPEASNVTALRAETNGPATAPDAEITSAAKRLQAGIRDRVNGRAGPQDRDDFVRALQTVLAAANK